MERIFSRAACTGTQDPDMPNNRQFYIHRRRNILLRQVVHLLLASRRELFVPMPIARARIGVNIRWGVVS
jgi:hypothetical protein